MLLRVVIILLALPCLPAAAAILHQHLTIQKNCVVEVTLTSQKTYANPFTDVTVDALVTAPGGERLKIPAFWAGGNKWRFRYATAKIGMHTCRALCSDTGNPDLQGAVAEIEVVPYRGDNSLDRHGPVRIAADNRHFEHGDGEPFLWLGDTWWKGLCKRLTWEGFQELTADRKAKGFSVVQIVCGPYPDEGLFEPRWANEGGMPYTARDFSVVNPEYFDYADRRIRCLIDAGIVPAIVGGWGRGGSLEAIGLAGYKRHWRNLIARYAAYPVVWIIGGEAGGAQWTDVARFVRKTDPYHRPATLHPADSARESVTDESVIDFDMLQTGHGDWSAAVGAVPKIRAAIARKPAMPALVGEACYEGHMQSAYQDIERYLFWTCMLSGAAGHTYGAAGVWHASVEGDPGITPIYDWTTWKVGMNFPGSTQVGLGKKLLEKYPWSKFEAHPDWAEMDCFAAGVPGEVRFIYQPRRNVYNWNGANVKQIERDVPYHAYYFNPTDGKRHDAGTFINAGPPPKPFESHTLPLLFQDKFEGLDRQNWKDYGSRSQRQNGCLVGTKGMVTVLDEITGVDLMASVEAHSNAEAGIILRYIDPDNYLVALYSPLFKCIYLHDRKNGEWGDQLGRVDVSGVGTNIRLTAAAHGAYAAMIITDGSKTWYTPMVKVGNLTSGRPGLWLYQIGDRQEFRNFELSRADFKALISPAAKRVQTVLTSNEFHAPALPSPQDWVLVLERMR